MYWHCRICANIMIEEVKIIHLESKPHISFVNSIIRKDIISIPLTDKIEDTIKKDLRIHYDKFDKIRIVLLLTLLMPSNQIIFIRIQRSSYCYKSRFSNAFFSSKIKIIKEQLFSKY